MRQGTKAIRQRTLALLALASGIIFVPSAAAWTVTLTANTSLERTHHWTIAKSASASAVTLKPGETATVDYVVVVSHAGSVDSDWRVSGAVSMTSDPSITVNSVAVTVHPDNLAASVGCNQAFPASLTATLLCNYSVAVPDADPGVARMHATLVGGGRVVETPYSFAGAAVNDIDECVNVTDSLADVLGTVCASDGSTTFAYSKTIGPFTEEQCGEHVVDNTARFLTNDTSSGRESSTRVNVTVECSVPDSCTRTIGYWKTHAGFGPQADVVSPLLSIWLGSAAGTNSLNVATAAQAKSLLEFYGSNGVKAASNGINKLYAQLLGAKLNGASGANLGSVASVIASADAFLASHNSLSWSGLSAAQRNTVNGWKSSLDSYNNGALGAQHCDS